jgi:hypothetical protein
VKVSVTQIYIEPGVWFPFSHHMQRFLREQLSTLSGEASEFCKKYGNNFALTINISAKQQIASSQIKGPSVFRKTRDVEYTLFLPFDAIMTPLGGCRAAAEFLLDGVRTIFQKVGIEIAPLDEKRASIIEHLCSDPTMLDEPWPSHQGSKEGP